MFEGRQMFSLKHICDVCERQTLVFIGAAIDMPLSTALAEELVLAEAHHERVCPGPPPPEPKFCPPVETPY